MSTGAELLIAAVIVLAAFFVAYVALVVRVLGAAEIGKNRHWALRIVLAPLVAAETGMRWHLSLCVLLLVLYGALRYWLLR